MSLLLLLLAQASGGVVAQPSPDEQAVLAPVEAMFDGIAAADPAAIRAQLRTDGSGGATVVGVRADGSKILRHLTWDENLAHVRPGPHRNQERFVGRPQVRIDGDIAMVWGEFVFLVDGKVTHCGVDHFDLVREPGGWRIQNVTWSQRTTGCSQ